MGAGAGSDCTEMSTERPQIRLRPREDRRIRNGTPWVFSNEIVMDAAAKALLPGTLVELVSAEGAPIACGYFNSRSLISVRLLGPPGTAIDIAFFAGAFTRARKLRETLYSEPYYRLINAEGDGLPGLTIDRFDGTCIAQITTAGMENLLEPVLAALDQVVAPAATILRNNSASRRSKACSFIRVAQKETFRKGLKCRKMARAILLTPGKGRNLAGIMISGTTGCSWRGSAPGACWMPIVTVADFPFSRP